MPRTKSQARPWTKRETDLLGTKDDHEIAKKLGRSYFSVNIKRRTLGIPRFREQVFQANKRILFDYNCKDLAKRLGISPSTVIDWRNRVRLPLKDRWNAERIALLGTMPDTVFSKQFQINTKAVRKKRNELGIPSFTRRNTPWSEENLALLGTMPDTELGKRIGRSCTAVRAKRNRLGIPPYERPVHNWTKRQIAMLGKISDAKLAKKLGLAKNDVLTARRRFKVKGQNQYCLPPTPPKNTEEEIRISPATKKILTVISRHQQGITLLNLNDMCRLPSDRLITVVNELISSNAVALVKAEPVTLKLTRSLNQIFNQLYSD